MSASPIRVLLVDDHAMFRAGLRKLLEAEPGFSVVGEATGGTDAAALVGRLAPDILLLDLAMPGTSGLDVLRQMGNQRKKPRSVILTASLGEMDVTELLRAGAAGVLLKTSAIELLYKCLRAVMAGEYWVGRDAVGSLVEAMARTDARTGGGRPFGLTPRELDVVTLVAKGRGNKEIASQLGIGEDTVKHHVGRAFEKTGATSRLELALLANEHKVAGRRRLS